MRWLFRRSRSAAETTCAAAAPPPAAPAPAWEAVASLNPTARKIVLTAPTEVFEAGLHTRQPPWLALEPLGHDVVLGAPAGVARGLAEVVGRQNDVGPEMTLPTPAPRADDREAPRTSSRDRGFRGATPRQPSTGSATSPQPANWEPMTVGLSGALPGSGAAVSPFPIRVAREVEGAEAPPRSLLRATSDQPTAAPAPGGVGSAAVVTGPIPPDAGLPPGVPAVPPPLITVDSADPRPDQPAAPSQPDPDPAQRPAATGRRLGLGSPLPVPAAPAVPPPATAQLLRRRREDRPIGMGPPSAGVDEERSSPEGIHTGNATSVNPSASASVFDPEVGGIAARAGSQDVGPSASASPVLDATGRSPSSSAERHTAGVPRVEPSADAPPPDMGDEPHTQESRASTLLPGPLLGARAETPPPSAASTAAWLKEPPPEAAGLTEAPRPVPMAPPEPAGTPGDTSHPSIPMGRAPLAGASPVVPTLVTAATDERPGSGGGVTAVRSDGSLPNHVLDGGAADAPRSSGLTAPNGLGDLQTIRPATAGSSTTPSIGTRALASARTPVQRLVAAAPPPPSWASAAAPDHRHALDAPAGPVGPAIADTRPSEPVPPSLRGEVEATLGADLFDVQVKRGSGATSESRRIGARGFTAGRAVHVPAAHGPLAAGPGRSLLVHELVHAAQQQRLGPDLPSEDTNVGQGLEDEARLLERTWRHPAGNGPRATAEPGPVQQLASAEPAPAPAPKPGACSDPGHHVQRAEGDAEPAPAPSGASATAPAGGGSDLEQMADQLFPRIRGRLLSELRDYRERSGTLVDL